MKTLKDLLKEIKEEKKRVICFGTGLMAEEAVRYREIQQALVCMVDNDIEKQGTEVELDGYYYPVIAPENLRSYIEENTVMLLTSGHYRSMREQLEKLGMSKDIDIYDFPEIRVAYTADSEEFFEERILKECLQEYEIVLEQYHITGKEKEERLSKKEQYIRGVGALDRPLILPRIMIMPTTRCNMRCEGCSSLLPLFENPSDVKIEQVLHDFELFFSGIDECIRITVGGEPFLYPYLEEILKYLLEQKKVLGILLITNSTILPKQEIVELLKNPKILLEISDYGHLEKMSRLIQLLEENGVDFKVLTDQFWTDMGGVECRNRSEDELRFNYLNCNQSKVIKGFHNGKFYTCARSARMNTLGVYQSDNDYFDLKEEDSPDVIRDKLKALFYSEHADACNFCDLGVLPTRVIEAGIQMHGNMKKSAYTIVNREEYEELKRLAKIK